MLRDNGIPSSRSTAAGRSPTTGPDSSSRICSFDLKPARLGVREMVRALELAVIEFLATLGIDAYGKPAAPGVYVARGGAEAKIAALGLKVSNGCTYHGLALNVAMDLAPVRGDRSLRLSRPRRHAARRSSA